VHCHSYRQDEILMLVRLADDFDFTIGTFQHVLEGYKVAEAIAEHGAGASTFSDWWAYKVEVRDAIPFNGALMHDVGVLVSFNSDSSELARRMNTEAAKAVRYGGLDPHEALKFVTINPAQQLEIHDTVGSLEPGKDADFVIWSDSPLSTYARCEQTWIEGARYFDLETDRMLREHIAVERHRLIQKILADANDKPSSGGNKDKGDKTDARSSHPTALDAPYSCCRSHRP
jgi:imidazolonepropionase-like amidohydrolase